ncbi:hypothetical protein BV898_19625 [Hypsibius exemplaris]|uniref:Uncharacterized protein n=1 Tax=Hypsibius exemplaris TaxID=2072580 RepID=A0A9X6RPM1_HYPEX|nr:hypothetical protein BV898_19625 [Hypsibius exemplaris]
MIVVGTVDASGRGLTFLPHQPGLRRHDYNRAGYGKFRHAANPFDEGLLFNMLSGNLRTTISKVRLLTRQQKVKNY